MSKKRKNQDKVNNKPLKKDDDSKLFAWLATFLSIIGFIVAIIVKKENKYVMYYAKLSLVIFIIMVASAIIKAIVGWIPITGKIVSIGLSILCVILWLVSWIYALSGEEKEIPVISDWAKKFNF
jgi:uncharacterized membrane protein